MVNYSNGKIYKIEPINGDNMIYIGSTTKEYLSQRMDTHRRGYKFWKDGKVNKVMSNEMFDKYGIENCQILLKENFSCETKDQLTAREAFYQRTIECINKRIEGRTKQEHSTYYYNSKKEIILS
jgi:predicted GIY-YIG superfamily endonuclease